MSLRGETIAAYVRELWRGRHNSTLAERLGVVCEYDSEHCLLSDRAFSQPITGGPHMAFSFVRDLDLDQSLAFEAALI
jgi:hypothetical protein